MQFSHLLFDFLPSPTASPLPSEGNHTFWWRFNLLSSFLCKPTSSLAQGNLSAQKHHKSTWQWRSPLEQQRWELHSCWFSDREGGVHFPHKTQSQLNGSKFPFPIPFVSNFCFQQSGSTTSGGYAGQYVKAAGLGEPQWQSLCLLTAVDICWCVCHCLLQCRWPEDLRPLQKVELNCTNHPLLEQLLCWYGSWGRKKVKKMFKMSWRSHSCTAESRQYHKQPNSLWLPLDLNQPDWP